MSNNIPRYAAGDAMDRINTGQEVLSIMITMTDGNL